MLLEGKDLIYIILLHLKIKYKVRHIVGFQQIFLNEGVYKMSLWIVECIFFQEV